MHKDNLTRRDFGLCAFLGIGTLAAGAAPLSIDPGKEEVRPAASRPRLPNTRHRRPIVQLSPLAGHHWGFLDELDRKPSRFRHVAKFLGGSHYPDTRVGEELLFALPFLQVLEGLVAAERGVIVDVVDYDSRGLWKRPRYVTVSQGNLPAMAIVCEGVILAKLPGERIAIEVRTFQSRGANLIWAIQSTRDSPNFALRWWNRWTRYQELPPGSRNG